MQEAMIEELTQGLLKVLQRQIKRIVLYGSVARNMATSESDIDIAVFVNERITEQQEDALSDFIVDLNLKYNKVFSVIDIEQKKYEKCKNNLPIYRNIDEEGKVLWMAA